MKSGVMPCPAVWSGVPCWSAPRSTGGAAMEVQDRSAPRPEIVELAARLAPTLAARAAAFDEADAFAGEDFDDLLAGGFTEPESGGNWWYQATTAVPLDGGGWRLQGVKSFFTGFPRATHLLLSAAVETEAGREPIAFLVPKPERGIRVLGDWRAMGMRATGSHAIAVDELEVPAECVVDQGFGVAASFLLASHWSWPSFASVFLGAAEAAYRYVVETLPGRRNEGLGRSLAELPGVHQAVGEMRMRLDAARAALYAAVSRPPDPDPTAHYGRMAGAKLFTCQTALDVCTI